MTGGRTCGGQSGTGTCGAAPAGLYPAGWRCADHAPARLAGIPEPPGVPLRPGRLAAAPAAPCRYCGRTAYGGDSDGPAHDCCHAWRAVIAAGRPCPACQVAQVIARQPAGPDGTPRAVRLPSLPPLPAMLPDGRPYVPALSRDLPAHTTERSTLMLDAALAAAARGWHVFPLRPGTKRPAFPGHDAGDCDRTDPRCRDGHAGWEPRATTDPGRIRRGWAHTPWNVGIACGPSRLVVVDLDTPKPGKTPPPEWDLPGIVTGADVLAVLCERAGQPWPGDTWTVTTPSGGTHLYFTAPEGGPQLRNTTGSGTGLGWLVDTRAAGGLVVAAGSTVDGRRYTVTCDAPPAPLPAWLAGQLRPAPLPPQEPVTVDLPDKRASGYLRAAVDGEIARVLDAPGGGRNNALFDAAVALGQLAAGGSLSESDVTAWLTAAACKVGQKPGETARTIASGLRTGALRPRSVAA
jgi:hypothetical protein